MVRAIEAAKGGATSGGLAQALGFGEDQPFMVPLTPHPYAAPFEELRDAADDFAQRFGKRPSIWLANLGTPAMFTARATFAKNFFEAGGFEVVATPGFPPPKPPTPSIDAIWLPDRRA